MRGLHAFARVAQHLRRDVELDAQPRAPRAAAVA
jgi:hypothetical protein